MAERDDSAALVERVREAAAAGTPLAIEGAGSRRALGHDAHGEPLSTLGHSGIVNHEPTELVLTARAGTPIRTLTEALAEARQMLPFEPPDEGGTLGGVIACALSGPRRPYAGAVRDFVLGTTVVNGRGQRLAFGGEVMKNVAGYDVSRVQVGAFGTLGLVLEVSMKVLPIPEEELTLHHELDGGAEGAPGVADSLVALARTPLPLSASLVHGRERFIRLGGSRVAVERAAARLGGSRVAPEEAPWQGVRERTHPFFAASGEGGGDGQRGGEGNGARALWRIAVADHAPPIRLPGEWLLDWGGAQRWLWSAAPAAEVFAAAAAAGGHATRYRGVVDGVPETFGGPLFQPLEGAMRRLQSRLRDSFDPERLFNRGRFHPELDPEPRSARHGGVEGRASDADRVALTDAR